ncbi:DNA-directed RNA polymerase II subunit RPB1-like 15, partial [Homarus americanus]
SRPEIHEVSGLILNIDISLLPPPLPPSWPPSVSGPDTEPQGPQHSLCSSLKDPGAGTPPQYTDQCPEPTPQLRFLESQASTSRESLPSPLSLTTPRGCPPDPLSGNDTQLLSLPTTTLSELQTKLFMTLLFAWSFTPSLVLAQGSPPSPTAPLPSLHTVVPLHSRGSVYSPQSLPDSSSFVVVPFLLSDCARERSLSPHRPVPTSCWAARPRKGDLGHLRCLVVVLLLLLLLLLRVGGWVARLPGAWSGASSSLTVRERECFSEQDLDLKTFRTPATSPRAPPPPPTPVDRPRSIPAAHLHEVGGGGQLHPPPSPQDQVVEVSSSTPETRDTGLMSVHHARETGYAPRSLTATCVLTLSFSLLTFLVLSDSLVSREAEPRWARSGRSTPVPKHHTQPTVPQHHTQPTVPQHHTQPTVPPHPHPAAHSTNYTPTPHPAHSTQYHTHPQCPNTTPSPQLQHHTQPTHPNTTPSPTHPAYSSAPTPHPAHSTPHHTQPTPPQHHTQPTVPNTTPSPQYTTPSPQCTPHSHQPTVPQPHTQPTVPNTTPSPGNTTHHTPNTTPSHTPQHHTQPTVHPPSIGAHTQHHTQPTVPTPHPAHNPNTTPSLQHPNTTPTNTPTPHPYNTNTTPSPHSNTTPSPQYPYTTPSPQYPNTTPSPHNPTHTQPTVPQHHTAHSTPNTTLTSQCPNTTPSPQCPHTNTTPSPQYPNTTPSPQYPNTTPSPQYLKTTPSP